MSYIRLAIRQVASILDTKFLLVTFDLNSLDGLILEHVTHPLSHLMKLLPLFVLTCFTFNNPDEQRSS